MVKQSCKHNINQCILKETLSENIEELGNTLCIIVIGGSNDIPEILSNKMSPDSIDIVKLAR